MLILYMLEACPYCKKVVENLEEHNLEFRSLDISNPVNLDELLVLGEKEQVPFLVDTENNVKMYESDEIIQYIETL